MTLMPRSRSADHLAGRHPAGDALNSSAAVNMPHCLIIWATPTLRRNVDFPPWLAPVSTISRVPSADTSLPTTRSVICSDRQGYKGRARRGRAGPLASGTGKQVGSPLPASRWRTFTHPTLKASSLRSGRN